jgi:signal transduction histidine kinase
MFVCVRLQDTGIGIADDEKIHIFERFYKADKARARGESGSGLGLSIVKRIVDMHGGEIAVDSQLGQGTTFVVKLPNRESGSM